jgi:DNA-binding response OmpR family regulator
MVEGERPKEDGGADPGEVDRQPTVLLIEDDETVRSLMAMILVQEGYFVLTAATGRDAIAILRQPLSAVDVVVLDVHLPDINGTDVCACLRRLQPQLPVIVVSGEATPEEVAQLLRFGAHRYLQKPVTPDELLATVEAALP